MGRIAMCALPAAVQAFSQKERKTETSVAPLLMGRTAFCSEAEGRGRGSVCVSAQRGGSRRRTLVPLRRAPPPPSPQEPCLALEPVGAEWGPGCLGGPEFGGREAVSDEPPRRPTGHVDVPRTALVRARSPQGWRRKEPVSRRSLRGSGQEGRQAPGEGQGTSPFRFHLREQKTVSRGTGRICARAPRGVGRLTPHSGRRGQEALHPPPVLPPLFTVRAGGWGRVGEEHAAGDWRSRASNPGPLTLSPACFGREGGCGRAGGKLPRIEVRNVVCGPQVPHRNPLRGPAHLCSPLFIHPCGLDVNSL